MKRLLGYGMIATSLLAIGCSCLAFLGPLLPGACPVSYDHDVPNVTNYSWRQTHVTPKGIRVDAHNVTPGSSAEAPYLQAIDQRADAVETCTGRRMYRCAFRVQIAGDSRLAPDGSQVFPCLVPSGWCHGAEQSPATAVVTPDLSALNEELTHIVTGASEGDPGIARCR